MPRTVDPRVGNPRPFQIPLPDLEQPDERSLAGWRADLLPASADLLLTCHPQAHKRPIHWIGRKSLYPLRLGMVPRGGFEPPTP